MASFSSPLYMEEVCCKNPDSQKGNSRDFRYWLQKAGQRLLYHYDQSKDRISFGGCGMGLRYNAEALKIHYHEDTASMSFIGLAHCGNPWVCPVCAPRIGAGRMEEIKKITAAMIGRGCSYLFVTFTAHHDANTSLLDFGEKIKKAKRAFNACVIYKRLKERFSLRHSISATEVTDDDPSVPAGLRTGWHFHLHGLLFLERPFLTRREASEFAFLASTAWQRECEKVGLVASLDRGFHLQTIQDYAKKTGLKVDFDVWSEEKKDVYVAQVSEYFAKSLGFELTGATRKNSKKGKFGAQRVTQWGLMLEAIKGNSRARERWIDFVHSMKGFNVIRCSPGLKKLCDIDEKSDKAFLQGEEAQEIVVFGKDGLCSSDWVPVAKQGRMGHLLTLAQEFEPVKVIKKACRLARFGFDVLTREYLGIARFNPVWAGCDKCPPVRIGEHFNSIEKNIADVNDALFEEKKEVERKKRREKRALFDKAIDALDPSVVFASMKNLLYARKRREKQGLSLAPVPLSLPWTGSLNKSQYLLPGFFFEKIRGRFCKKDYEKNFSLKFSPMRS